MNVLGSIIGFLIAAWAIPFSIILLYKSEMK
jgi:hypothetical protein